MKWLKNAFPITDWLSNYKISLLSSDVSAGITVGVMLIPQGMAYAMIAGLPPVYGLYASIVPQLIYAILGTSRQLSVAPVAMDSLLVAAGVSVMATEGTGTYIALAILVAFFMGIFQLLLGVFRLGFITNLLSRPVISGFTSAAAIIIGINQLKYLMGVDIPRSNAVYEVLLGALQMIPQTHWLTFIIGFAGVILLISLKKLNPSVPGALVAVTLGIGVVFAFRMDLSGVSIVKEIPDGLPRLVLPDLSTKFLLRIIPLALTISVVAFMEAYSVSKALEAKSKSHKVRPNQELIALGASNIIGSLFQSFPVTGGFSRSAVNFQAGAKTPLASIISAIIVGLTLLFLTPLFYYLPQAILASIILVAVAGLIDIRYILTLWRVRKEEFVVLMITFSVTLFFSMIPGIVTGIGFSVLMVLYRLAYPHMTELGKLKGFKIYRNVNRFKELETWDNLLIVRIDAPWLFININQIREKIEEKAQSRKGLETIIIDAGPSHLVDITATEQLKGFIDEMKQQNIQIAFCGLIGPVRDLLSKAGILNEEKFNAFLDVDEAVRYYIQDEKPAKKEAALQSFDK